jgi:hypothetical protein
MITTLRFMASLSLLMMSWSTEKRREGEGGQETGKA